MFDDFSGPLDKHWTETAFGGGYLQLTDSVLRMGFDAAQAGHYTDAQIDDYTGRTRSDFLWRPPLRMEVRAHASSPVAPLTGLTASQEVLLGTAGFGFWNYPFSARGAVLTLPEAVWFFYASPPSNMALVPGIPGWGWKAQIVHSMRPGVIAATLPMAASTLWARMSGETHAAAHWMQRLTGAHEAILPVSITEWHTYVLEWLPTEARFRVDDTLVLEATHPPTRPLGFVAWLDNQYAIATPKGVLKFGTVSSGPQWLEIDSVRIELL